MEISLDAVKELREKSAAGMMDCKQALQEAKGDMEKAFEILRKKGVALAQKKSSREAKEGILATPSTENGKVASLVEVNCETDFVIQTDDFQNFVKNVAKVVHEKEPKDLGGLMEASYPNGPKGPKGGTVQSALTELIGKIGENIQVRRFIRWEKKSDKDIFGIYLHAGSKIGVVVEIADDAKKITGEAAKEVAMHVAAMHPKYVRTSDVPAEEIAKEKEILRTQIDTKKPKEIQEKIIEGKLRKFYAEVCLEDQIFVKDLEGKQSVKQWLQHVSPSAKIQRFVRLQVGG